MRRLPFPFQLGALFALGVLGAAIAGRLLRPHEPATEPLPYYVDSTRTPVWLTAGAARGAHRVGDFTLVDQAGRPVTRGTASLTRAPVIAMKQAKAARCGLAFAMNFSSHSSGTSFG